MRIAFIDDGFRRWIGHNSTYDLAICAELDRQGVDYRLFVHENMRAWSTSHPNVVPAFKNFSSEAMLSIQYGFLPTRVNQAIGLAVANWSHYRDLVRHVSLWVSNQDLILVGVQLPSSSYAYAFWLRYLAARQRHVTILFVVHNVPSRIFKQDMLFLRTLAAGHRVVLAAHTLPIVQMCQEITAQKCILLPLPFIQAGGALRPVQRAAQARVAFAYLGTASYNKGFDLVLEAIGLLRDLFDGRTITLIVQCNNLPLGHPDREAANALALTIPGIELLTQPLSPAQYYYAMQRAEIILIPNRPEYYRYALSGVFTEALAQGKPVIVADDTYAAVELAEHGAGLTFRSGNAGALAEAIRAATVQVVELQRRAQAARGAWLDLHNPKRYVDCLLEIGCTAFAELP